MKQVTLNADLLTATQYEKLIGNYTASAIRTKISRGVWKEGHEYHTAPDNRKLISIKGVEAWAKSKMNIPSQRSGATTSESTLDLKAKSTRRV